VRVNLPDIDVLKLPADQRGFGQTVKVAMEKIRDMFRGVREHVVIEFDAQHGVETPVANPLSSGLPVGIQVIDAWDTATGNPVAVESALKLNRARSDGMLGITATFDLKHTEPMMQRQHSTTQGIPSGTSTVAVFDTQTASRGSVISYNAGVFTLSEPGTYAAYCEMPYETGVAYTSGDAFIRINGGTIEAEQWVRAALTDGSRFNASAIFTRSTANITVEFMAYQTNTGPSSRNLLANSTRCGISRLYNDSTPIYRLRCIVWGA
jgi:hypothetical protein